MSQVPSVQILNTLNVPYETVNILEDELLRSGMKEYSQWPTFPQVYIDGEFYGGADIMIGWHLFAQQSDKIAHACIHHEPGNPPAEAYTNGELKEHLEVCLNS